MAKSPSDRDPYTLPLLIVIVGVALLVLFGIGWNVVVGPPTAASVGAGAVTAKAAPHR